MVEPLFLSHTPPPPPPLRRHHRPLHHSPPFLHPWPRPQRSNLSTTPKSSNFKNESTEPEPQCPVPLNQLPINEYQSLSTSFPFSWVSTNPIDYSSRLLATGLSFALILGFPVSWFGSDHDPVKLLLGSLSSGLFAVTLAVVRMYLGWAYVGNRLLSATVEYEETGWYDGQIWVKPAEVLARDRLLGSFQVKPALNRLKDSLIALAISLFVCVTLLIDYEGNHTKEAMRSSGERVIAGVYNDESARSFEPDAFCGDSGE